RRRPVPGYRPGAPRPVPPTRGDGMTFPMLTLFAQNEKRSEAFLQRTEDWIVVGLLAGVLLAGAVVLWMVDRWRKQGARDEKRAGEELTSFRTMYERGEITEEE